MTTSKTIQLQRTGLTPIDVEPVWDKDNIIMFDMFEGDVWLGSRRLLKQCEEFIKEPELNQEVSKERTWPRVVATILINEIIPRVKKNKLTLSDFPTAYCAILSSLEFTGKIDRKQHRKFLDEHVAWVKAGRPRDEEEDKKLIEEINARL